MYGENENTFKLRFRHSGG